MASTRPDLAAEWHPNKNLPLSAHDLTLRSKQKVWWKCQKGHEWQMDIRTRVSGIGNCPYCMGKRVCEENALSTLSPHIAKQWHPEKMGRLRLIV
ncbi:MAG TPA: zinc-ribbon domain-containing protein [Candidatus Agathobaculum merdigallinarum]|nr:zinc-ribbon domain-containing protein [Candidatus Agathobaculum merdigallinarum]